MDLNTEVLRRHAKAVRDQLMADINEARVRGYTRRSKTGKQVQVRDFERRDKSGAKKKETYTQRNLRLHKAALKKGGGKDLRKFGPGSRPRRQKTEDEMIKDRLSKGKSVASILGDNGGRVDNSSHLKREHDQVKAELAQSDAEILAKAKAGGRGAGGLPDHEFIKAYRKDRKDALSSLKKSIKKHSSGKGPRVKRRRGGKNPFQHGDYIAPGS